jgi:hypothetical protein
VERRSGGQERSDRGIDTDQAARPTIGQFWELRIWFLIFAFVSIGLEFSLKGGLREAGWRPVALFASATLVNIVVTLGLAAVLFGSFTIG